MSETIFLRESNTEYCLINKQFLEDTRLSWQAKGVMCYLLSLPEEYRLNLSQLEEYASNGRDSLRSAVRELKQFGYVEQYQTKERGRFSKCVFNVIEKPPIPPTVAIKRKTYQKPQDDCEILYRVY